MGLNVDELKAKVLDLAIRGKLVDSSLYTNESGDELVKRIKTEREQSTISGRKSGSKVISGNFYESIPFEIPSSWTWAYLSDVNLIIMGQSPDGSSVTDDEKSGIEFHQGKADFGEMYIKPSGKFTNAPNKIAKQGSILISMRAPVGTLNFTNRDICIGRGLAAIEPNPELSKKYMFFAISSLENYLKEQSTGTTIEAITGQILASLLIPIPPVEEQTEIVKRVEVLFKLIEDLSEEADSQLKTINLLRQKTLDLAIRGKLISQDENDEPASELLKRILSEKEKLIKEKIIKKPAELKPISDDEIPYEIPENWEWVRLGDVTSYGTNITLNPSEISDSEWVLELEDIEKDTGRVLEIIQNNVRKCKSNKNKFFKDDVLYGKLRPYLKKVLKAPSDGVCTTEIVAFRGYGELNSDYLVFYLKSEFVNNIVNDITHGMNMPRLGTNNARNLFFPLPPLKEQLQIVKKVEVVFSILDNIESEIKRSICLCNIIA